jgi:hypothetical protein
VYLLPTSGGRRAIKCYDVDINICENQGARKTCEHFFTSEETNDTGEVRYIYDRREEKAWDDDAKREIQDADGSDGGSHQGNSNRAGGVGFL